MNKLSYYWYSLSLLILFGVRWGYTSDHIVAFQSDSNDSQKSIDYILLNRSQIDQKQTDPNQSEEESSFIGMDNSKKSACGSYSSSSEIKKPTEKERKAANSLKLSSQSLHESRAPSIRSKAESLNKNPFFFNDYHETIKQEEIQKPEIAFTTSVFVYEKKESGAEYSEPSHSSIIEQTLENRESFSQESNLLPSALNKAFLLSSNQPFGLSSLNGLNSNVISNTLRNNVSVPLKSSTPVSEKETSEINQVKTESDSESSIQNSSSYQPSACQNSRQTENNESVAIKSSTTPPSQSRIDHPDEQETLEKINERNRVFLHFFGGPSSEQEDIKQTCTRLEPVLIREHNEIPQRQVQPAIRHRQKITSYIKLTKPLKTKNSLKSLPPKKALKMVEQLGESQENQEFPKQTIRATQAIPEQKGNEHRLISILTMDKPYQKPPKTTPHPTRKFKDLF